MLLALSKDMERQQNLKLISSIIITFDNIKVTDTFFVRTILYEQETHFGSKSKKIRNNASLRTKKN